MIKNRNPFIQSKILVVLLASLLSLTSYSETVDVQKAQTVAVNFAKQIDAKSNDMSLVYTKDNTAYVFSSENAWIMIAANDKVNPILAYSTESSFRIPQSASDTIIGENFWGFIKSYEDQIRFVVENNISATDEIKTQWQTLSSKMASQVSNDRGTTAVVTPLLTTIWGQGWPYNSMCPSDPAGPNGHVWAGCVATAMAQIMKYHNYPSQGLGSYGYQWGSYPYSGAEFGTTTYNWANMPNSISSVNTDVATITYHAAVATRSMWGAGSTGVMVTSNDNPMLLAFINYFKMAFSSIQYVLKSNYSDSEWHTLIQNELVNNRPVYYRGDGSLSHAWVCDGVDINDMYHFNWGWDGMYNGYFALSNLNPGGNNLTNNQHALIGIQPNDGSTLVSNTTWTGNLSKTTNIAIPDAITLTIDPGTIISFGQDCKLQVWGNLNSIGTATNYVQFTAIDTTDGWDGIDWKEDYLNRMADNDTSRIVYSQIEYSNSSGIYCYNYGKVLVNHCKVNNNVGFNGAGIFVNNNSIKISNSEIYNNYSTNVGGGLYLNLTDNAIVNISHNDIYNNSAVKGGGFWLYSHDNTSFTNNTLHRNYATMGAGGSLSNGSPSLVNNKFVNNITPFPGYGCLYLENCSANIVGNLIANNTATGIRLENSSPIILNNTIVNNNHNGGSIIFVDNSDAIIKNCIIYGNISNMPNLGNQISIADDNSNPIFDYCNIQGGLAGFGGPGSGSNYDPANYTNNIDADPIFANPSTGAGDGYDGLLADFRLQGDSPCIDAGTTNGITDLLPDLDLADNPRIIGIIDMGAYEYCAPAQPGIITGNASPCESSDQTYSVMHVAGITYNWTVPAGSTITNGQGSNAITVTVGSASGNILVSPSNSCGTGTPSSINVIPVCCSSWIPLSNLQFNMQLVAQILINGQVSLNPNDVLGAFVGGECRGIASPDPAQDGIIFLTISSNVASGEQIEFKIWNSNECSECNAIPGFAFINQAEVGTFLEPYQVRCGAIQDITFGQGYTWFSVNVNPGSMAPAFLFTDLTPCYDDRVIGQTSFALYTGTNWIGSLTNLGLDKMYRMKLCSSQSISLMGDAAVLNPISLNAGYTWLGYQPQQCQTVSAAMAGLSPGPSYDDRVIGQSSFALFTGSTWVGSLTQMCPGKGYVIKLANAQTLTYPAPSAKNSSGELQTIELVSPTGIYPSVNHQHTMMVVAKLQLPHGMISLNEKDVVYAYINGEVRGMGNPMTDTDGAIFMSISDDEDLSKPITFMVWLDEKQQLLPLNESLSFEPLAAVGDLNNPFIFTLGEMVGVNEAVGGIWIGEPYPNPFTEQTVIPYTLPWPAKIKVLLYNNLGQPLMEIEAYIEIAGNHKFLLKNVPFTSGLYALVFEINSQKGIFRKSQIVIIKGSVLN